MAGAASRPGCASRRGLMLSGKGASHARAVFVPLMVLGEETCRLQRVGQELGAVKGT